MYLLLNLIPQVAKQLKFVERSKASTDAISLYLMTHDLWARLPLGLPTKDLTTTTSHFSFTKVKLQSFISKFYQRTSETCSTQQRVHKVVAKT